MKWQHMRKCAACLQLVHVLFRQHSELVYTVHNEEGRVFLLIYDNSRITSFIHSCMFKCMLC